MIETPTSIPVPMALRELINSNNALLQNYQQELSNKVILANQEMMKLIGINEQDGWKLNMTTMTYEKQETKTIKE